MPKLKSQCHDRSQNSSQNIYNSWQQYQLNESDPWWWQNLTCKHIYFKIKTHHSNYVTKCQIQMYFTTCMAMGLPWYSLSAVSSTFKQLLLKVFVKHICETTLLALMFSLLWDITNLYRMSSVMKVMLCVWSDNKIFSQTVCIWQKPLYLVSVIFNELQRLARYI